MTTILPENMVCTPVGHLKLQNNRTLFISSHHVPEFDFNKLKMFGGSVEALGINARGRRCWFLLEGKLWESLLGWIGIADYKQKDKKKRQCENVTKYMAYMELWRVDSFIRGRSALEIEMLLLVHLNLGWWGHRAGNQVSMSNTGRRIKSYK